MCLCGRQLVSCVSTLNPLLLCLIHLLVLWLPVCPYAFLRTSGRFARANDVVLPPLLLCRVDGFTSSRLTLRPESPEPC